KVEVKNIHSEFLNKENVAEKLGSLDGILVAPGFGSRGVEGKIEAIHYARVNKIPFLGISLGMQCAVIEFARNVLGWEKAHTTEVDAKTPFPVIYMAEVTKTKHQEPGTMRLGAYDCDIK